MSPGRVCDAARAPERISTTAKPRQDPTIRRARYVLGGPDDPPIARGDEDVDRKPHEERVDHVAGSDDEGVAGRQPVPAEQTALA